MKNVFFCLIKIVFEESKNAAGYQDHECHLQLMEPQSLDVASLGESWKDKTTTIFVWISSNLFDLLSLLPPEAENVAQVEENVWNREF